MLSTFTVINTDDSGPGSLRQAIEDANTHSGADIVKFKSVTGTIALASELLITDDLKIAGPGAQNLEVSGGGTTRVFHIAGGVPVEIKKLTISNGFVDGDLGAGIFNEGTLTLQNSVVTGCKQAGYGGGGGIENQGTLTARNSTISGNYAYAGGGLNNEYYATATLEDVIVSDNSGGFGAGITNFGADLSLDHSLIQGNTESGAGFNSAGGILFQGGTRLSITNSVIRDNVGATGGLNIFFPPNEEALISHSLITNNKGIINSNTPNPLMLYGAGGIDTGFGNVRIEYTTISDNLGGFAGGVGSLDSRAQPPVIFGSTISGNTAANPLLGSRGQAGLSLAGGVFGTARIESSTISGNTAVGSGSYVDFRGVTHTWQADSVAGGVLSGRVYDYYAPHDFASTSIDHSTIAFNKVTDAPAGAAFAGGVLGIYYGYGYGDANIAVRNTIIAKNETNLGSDDVNGTFISAGHNLIGVLGSSATGFVASDLSGTAAQPLDPRLFPLKRNGGFTNTHALKKNSPAIDAGDNTDAPLTDQRGKTRIVNGTIDIGSFEVQNNSGATSVDALIEAQDRFWGNYAATSGDEDQWLDFLAGHAGRKRGHHRH